MYTRIFGPCVARPRFFQDPGHPVVRIQVPRHKEQRNASKQKQHPRRKTYSQQQITDETCTTKRKGVATQTPYKKGNTICPNRNGNPTHQQHVRNPTAKTKGNQHNDKRRPRLNVKPYRR